MEREFLKIEKKLIVTTPWILENESGYSWTLVSRLGLFLKEAEKRYGRRDMAWTLLGIEFIEQRYSQIRYPLAGDKRMIVQLSIDAAQDEVLALSHLAGTCIHLLAPAGSAGKRTVLEEGLAVLFSMDDAVYGYAHYAHLDSSAADKKERKAAALVKSLLDGDGDSIRKLREQEGYFCRMTQDTFRKADVTASLTLIKTLLSDYEDFMKYEE